MPVSTPQPALTPARFGGLDGLRAISVALVLVYHLFPALLPGGFLGVDVFFAISGFLITSLLLRELETNGRIRLGDFWRRRARRLLPALGLVLLVSTSLALLVGGDLLVNIGRQIAGAAFFVSNWVYIGAGTDYFTRDDPELFRNTWSLSIEEQFYIALPLLLLLLFRMRGRQSRAIALGALGVTSAGWMAALSYADADPTRIYFGSDTHTFGLLLGAAMAALLHRGTGRTPNVPSAAVTPTRGQQTLFTSVAVAGLSVLGWCSFTVVEGSAASFRGGFQLATIAALAVVWAITRPGAAIGRTLDAAPLRWIGERSYGIYLWHWPLLLIVGTALDPVLSPALAPSAVGAITLAATFACAALSYRYVEQPIRRLGLRNACRRLASLRVTGRRQQIIATALGAVLVATIPATAYAVATAPTQSSSAEAIARGQAALEAAEGTQGPGTDADAGTEADASTEADSNTEADASTDAEDSLPQRIAPEGRDITAVGDSVMLASLPELTAGLPEISIDAAVSRGFGAGVEVAEVAAGQGSLRRVIVAGLGTNGPVRLEELEHLRAVAGDRAIVLVNAYGERAWIPEVNQTLTDFAADYPGIVVADWAGAVDGVPDALAGDGIHPNPSGGEIYTAALQQALAALQEPAEAVGYALPRR